MNFNRYYWTLRYLRPVQIYSRLRPRIGPRRTHVLATLRKAEGLWTDPPQLPSNQIGKSEFCFLNRRVDVAGGAEWRWNDPSLPKLWLYNLHYFDELNSCGAEKRRELLQEMLARWVAENPWGKGNGWEPYPISRRVVNWIKCALRDPAMMEPWLDSLAEQAYFLEKRIEWRFLANHLFENAKTLLFAGIFFEGRAAERWKRTGLQILKQQLLEQVLIDGGHFELSPMYHSLIWEDVLDLINLAQAYPDAVPQNYVTWWRSCAARMGAWLSNMCHPDGEIAFFNDASTGIAPEPAKLFRYADLLHVQRESLPLGESGYLRLERENTVVFFDAAEIGADYNPAHAHADSLSFEVSHRGRRVLVNSGTSNYESTPRRLAERGTAAHNTVVVDGVDQSEVWASFRVARRARIRYVATDGATFAEASHDGYRRLRAPVIHTRRVDLCDEGVRITDTFQGCGVHKLDWYFHVHPDSHVDLRLDPRLERIEMRGEYHPKFGVSVPNTRIVGQYRGPVPARFQSLLVLN